MINIFLSCSSKDYDTIKIIIDYLDSLPDYYRLLYFLRPYRNGVHYEKNNKDFT